MSAPSAVLIVVDTETGGLEPVDACVIELAAQVVEIRPGSLDVGEQFYTKIKPNMPVGDKAAEVNGYTPEKWTDAPDAKDALQTFATWVDEQCAGYKMKPMWCGCNPVFDLKFVNSDMRRVGVERPTKLSYRVIDVQSLCLPLLLAGDVPSLALKNLRVWAGCEGEQTHEAMNDVFDTCAVIAAFLLGST